MKIDRILCAAGFGSSYVTDLAAVRQGAKPDSVGMLIPGTPVTPGFDSIRQPASALSIIIVLDTGQTVRGDCMATLFPGRGRRAGIETPNAMRPIVEAVSSALSGCDAADFRSNDALLRDIGIGTDSLSPALRYGLSQALLNAAAIARRKTMVEVLAQDWNLPLRLEPVPLNLQTGPDFERGLDRIIMRRGDIIHSRNPHHPDMIPAVGAFLTRAAERVRQFGGAGYQPRIHIDFYGVLGTVHGRDVKAIADYLASTAELAQPLTVIFGDPVEMGSRDEQIEMMSAIRERLATRTGAITLLAEEHCLTADDHKAFVAAGACDYCKVRPLDLGNISDAMDTALLHGTERGKRRTGIYLTGSATETHVSAQVRAHIAMAVQADFTLASPGLGVDEAHATMSNEFRCAMAITGCR